MNCSQLLICAFVKIIVIMSILQLLVHFSKWNELNGVYYRTMFQLSVI